MSALTVLSGFFVVKSMGDMSSKWSEALKSRFMKSRKSKSGDFHNAAGWSNMTGVEVVMDCAGVAIFLVGVVNNLITGFFVGVVVVVVIVVVVFVVVLVGVSWTVLICSLILCALVFFTLYLHPSCTCGHSMSGPCTFLLCLVH